MSLKEQQQKKPRPSRVITADDRTKSSSHRRICRSPDHISPTKTPFIKFGPLFGKEEIQIQTAKDESWQHVVRSSQEGEAVTTEIYMSALREVEKEARESYDPDPSVTKLSGLDFRWMMIKDGCFFLQLSFSLLGGDDQVLGLIKHSSKLNKHKCVASMFHVGNQIPLVVLRELLEQKYFQQVIRDGNWELPTSDLAKLTLFQVLLSPVLERRRCIRIPNPCLRALGRRLNLSKHQLQNQSSDVLHGLNILLLGPETDPLKEEEDDDDNDGYDLEEERDGNKSDLEVGGSDPIGVIIAQKEKEEQEDDDTDDDKGVRHSATMKPKIKSATKLKQAGIHFKVIKTEGIRGIRFKSYLFYPQLCLPPLLVGSHTQLLLNNLKQYEISQTVHDSNRREVSSYLQFMRDLIRTSEDAKLLASDGIIKGSRKYTEKLPTILKDLVPDERGDDSCLSIVKVQINSYYRPPWVTQFGQYLTLVFLLSFVQTFYAVLAYHKPPKGD